MPPSNATAWVEALPWAEACLACVAFVCGAAVGSFLNVVAHRIPRGESPVTGRSRCPTCGSGILPRDNVPVLGWLLLRGRCRVCRGVISRRYVLVEAACGGLLAILAAARLACDPHGLDRLLVQGDVRLVLSVVGQAAVLMTLVAWSLLAERGHRVTRTTRWLTMAAALVWSVLVSMLSAKAQDPGHASSWHWLGPTLTSCAGGGIGWLAGAWIGCPPWRRCADGRTSAAVGDMLALVGLACGWQPVLVVAAVSAALRVVGRHTPIAGYAIPPATLLVMSSCGRWPDAIARFFDRLP